jgi:conjugal transfer pilus assembly protein TraW
MATLVRLLLALLSYVAITAHSVELGVVGPTYEITEPDLIEVIQSRLKRMEKSGELGRKQNDYRDRVIGGIEKPNAVSGINATLTPRTFYVDPTWTVDRDIRNAEGSLLFARGLKVNPLDHVSLSRKLVFFDGRDSRQVSLAQRNLEGPSGKSKLILVAGEPLKLMRSWKRPVFYDQGGVLVRKLGIRQVPAIVSQDGKRLRIDEVRP